MRYGGVVKGSERRVYSGGMVAYFDYCHWEQMSIIELCHMCKELGQKPESDFYF